MAQHGAADVVAFLDAIARVRRQVGEESAAAQQEDTRSRRRSRRRRNDDDAATANSGAVSAGKASKYIDKIIADERTNALIVLANEEGHKAVLELVDQLDKDTTGKYGSQINVVRLEQAKAQDVVDVLSRLCSTDEPDTVVLLSQDVL